MATTGAGLASTAITAGRALLRQEPAPNGQPSRPPAETGCLPEDPVPTELGNQAMPAPPAPYGPISHPRTQAL